MTKFEQFFGFKLVPDETPDIQTCEMYGVSKERSDELFKSFYKRIKDNPEKFKGLSSMIDIALEDCNNVNEAVQMLHIVFKSARDLAELISMRKFQKQINQEINN